MTEKAKKTPYSQNLLLHGARLTILSMDNEYRCIGTSTVLRQLTISLEIIGCLIALRTGKQHEMLKMLKKRRR